LKTIFSVVGARPNFMKVAPLHRALKAYPAVFEHRIVHTGQHYDREMSKVFFEDLELPQPDFYLGVGSGSHAEQTAKIMVEFEKILAQQRPAMVVVVGDVNSTVACSLVSVKMGIPVAHVEAGLRSFDRTMPEEINRLLTDAIAEELFVTEPSGVANLRREGISESKIHLVGNVMIDSLVHYRPKAERSHIVETLGLSRGNFVLVTMHRPSNVDEKDSLEGLLQGLATLAKRVPVVFPVHPRTRKMIGEFKSLDRTKNAPELKLVDPLGYLDFLKLMMNARLVVTDSGGIQEETTFLGIPCLTLRANTERPITIEVGTNELCGTDVPVMLKRSFEILDNKAKKGTVPELWDGKAADRIAHHLYQRMH
jgi:UDP-N-acetylglucosamine 2-epimerase (non-hydrolysing)